MIVPWREKYHEFSTYWSTGYATFWISGGRGMSNRLAVGTFRPGLLRGSCRSRGSVWKMGPHSTSGQSRGVTSHLKPDQPYLVDRTILQVWGGHVLGGTILSLWRLVGWMVKIPTPHLKWSWLGYYLEHHPRTSKVGIKLIKTVCKFPFMAVCHGLCMGVTNANYLQVLGDNPPNISYR